ncbi:MAG: sugar phosphate isomerase/epimerase [Puniceicoccales bacterium]|jgi:sugar phosphate isomerase/epimerase|nr:sugar phosphate isomerase/epimerase [Puniceicoccales bacterium]
MKVKHTLRFSLALAALAAGALNANAAPIPDDVRENGFAIGAQSYTFNRYSAFEAVERTAHAGGKVIEFFPGQRFSPSDKRSWGHVATDAQIEAMKAHLKKHGVRAVNYGVVGIPKNEAAARKIFEFAKKLDLYAITTESTESIDTVEKLAKEYDIRVGYHNHPRNPRNANYKVWNPKYIRDLVKDRDPRVGAAADIGHWATDGLNAVEGLKILEGRLVSIHAKDRPLLGKASRNLALGTGVVGVSEVLDELKRQNFKGNISIEHEDNWSNNVPEVASGIGFVRGYTKAKK